MKAKGYIDLKDLSGFRKIVDTKQAIKRFSKAVCSVKNENLDYAFSKFERLDRKETFKVKMTHL